MRQHLNMSDPLRCACGCGQPLRRRGQRWAAPACKARAYRARQRADQEQLRREVWDSVDLYLQLEEERDNLADRLDAVEDAYRQLEQAYHAFREQHRHCPSAPPRPWGGDAYAILGVRADAEPEAIEGAYKALVKKYHPDWGRGDPTSDARMKAVTAAYAEVKRVIRARPPAAASGERRRGFTPP